MSHKEPFRSKEMHLRNYALGILTESAYVVSLVLAAMVLVWLMFRWF